MFEGFGDWMMAPMSEGSNIPRGAMLGAAMSELGNAFDRNKRKQPGSSLQALLGTQNMMRQQALLGNPAAMPPQPAPAPTQWSVGTAPMMPFMPSTGF